MTEGPKMVAKSLRVGDHTFEVGKRGIVEIQAQPPIYQAKDKEGRLHLIFSPNKDAEWKMEEALIEVPKIHLDAS